MLDRLGRLFRAWMGFFISMGEDPEVMLQDAIEEMRITMPKLNSVLVATRATVIRLEEEHNALRRQDKNLSASIQAALREGTRDARLFLHAGLIAHAAGECSESAALLHEANELAAALMPSERALLAAHLPQ